MVDCCVLAISLTRLAYFLALVNIITLAIFAGYTVKLRKRQWLLEQRNGKELKELAQLQARVKELESQKSNA
jgi:hypothetical protein